MKRERALTKLLDLLSATDKRRGALVLALNLVLALLDTAGVASIVPFLAVLGNPGKVKTVAPLHWMYVHGGFRSTSSFLFWLGVGAFLMVVTSSMFSLVTTYASTRYIQMRRHSLGTRLLQVYLRQPYEFFLNRNSADMSKSLLSEVDAIVMQVIKPMIDLVSYGLVGIVLVSLLVFVDAALAAGITIVIGGAYAAIYLTVRRRLRRTGIARVQANRDRFKAASEAFGGIKDLKVLGREQAYLTRFRKASEQFSRYQYIQSTLSAAPKYLIEAVGFGGILALALTLMTTRQDLGQVLPLLGLYAFASYRLLPAAQQIYASISTLRFGWSAVDVVHEDLVASATPPRVDPPVTESLSLREGIRFEGVDFQYPGAPRYALQDVNLTIDARSSVGLVGATGAGKTTTVDLILGLLAPTHGRITIDGRALQEVGVRTWQRALGYVPQSIYLADTSVAENIAFGIDPRRIDHAAVERAARIANIHDFIVEQLPNGYDTEIGERGVRLSGGQRQRIGIARALYHDPAVLVLDEATSALDTATERAIMESVQRLNREKTVIIIAHRMSTVEHCDAIVLLDGGRIDAIGNFDELKRSNVQFRRLAVL